MSHYPRPSGILALLKKFTNRRRDLQRQKRRNRRPRLEALAKRELMAADAYAFRGDLVIDGSNGNDDKAEVFVHNSRYYRVALNGNDHYIKRSKITNSRVRFYGLNGNDFFRNNTSLPTSITDGGKGIDTMIGGSGTDRLNAEITLDNRVLTVRGSNSADNITVDWYKGYKKYKFTVHGTISGVRFSETFRTSWVDSIKVYGQKGNDRIENKTTIRNYIDGGRHDDTLIGWPGDDRLQGKQGG